MANIIGSITVNQNTIFELDADPTLSSPTLNIGVGDLCIVFGSPGLWQKQDTGTGASSFKRLDQGSSSDEDRAFTILHMGG